MSSMENTEGTQHDEDVEAHRRRGPHHATEGAPEEPGTTPESRGDFDDDAVEAHRKRHS